MVTWKRLGSVLDFGTSEEIKYGLSTQKGFVNDGRRQVRKYTYKGNHIADQFTFRPLDPSSTITNGLGNYISTHKENSGLDLKEMNTHKQP